MAVWKLQRPLASFGLSGHPEILAYTENQERTALVPIPDDGWGLVDEIFGDDPKVYVEAEVVDDMLKIDHIVEYQDW